MQDICTKPIGGYELMSSEGLKIMLTSRSTAQKLLIKELTSFSYKELHLEECIFEEDVTFSDTTLVSGTSENWKIYGVCFGKKVTFQNCSLEGADFFNVKFGELLIEKCSFSGAYFNHVQWPKPENIQGDRDSLRQLKHVLGEQGNHLDANLFHSLEMDAYWKELRSWNATKAAPLTWFQDAFVFLAGKVISNFGQSWFLPLFWFFAIGFGFFFFFDAAYQGLLSGSFRDRFWQFVNPLSDAISVNAADYKGAYSFWFLHKLISGFIVYHFIVALRRKTRNI